MPLQEQINGTIKHMEQKHPVVDVLRKLAQFFEAAAGLAVKLLRRNK